MSNPQSSEAELYFTAKELMDKERYQEARPYVTKLLEISPDEALYRGLKEELDIIDENKRYIEQKYNEAVDYINNDQPELAEPIVEELLEANPYEPRYRNLKARLKEKKRQMTQQAELERLKEEARQREKAKQNDDAQQDVVMDFPVPAASVETSAEIQQREEDNQQGDSPQETTEPELDKSGCNPLIPILLFILLILIGRLLDKL